MLVLTIRPDGSESVHIGEAVVKVIKHNSQTKLLIDAPKDVLVLRDKVKQRDLEGAK